MGKIQALCVREGEEGGGGAIVVRDSNRDPNMDTQDPVDTNKVKNVIFRFKGERKLFLFEIRTLSLVEINWKMS